MDEARDLRQRGIRLAKAGQKEEARELLQQSIRLDPDNEAAWLWLASVAQDNRERVFCLQKLLEINPTNEMALKAMAAATQPAAPMVKRLPNAPVTKAATPDIMDQAPGVPVPMPDKIASAQKDADEVVHSYLVPLPTTVKWVHKTHRRAGERDIIVYRVYVGIGIAAVLLVLIGAFVLLVQTNDNVREVVLGPSATPTPSPTITPTNTPGLTPTPSPTPRLTPTPSVTPPPNLLAASPPALPHATEVYPQILERGVYDSVLLMGQGAMAQAIPTLDYERKQTISTRLNPNPYYYEALAMATVGRFDEALSTLDEAAGRVGERPDDLRIMPFLDSGYAQVYWMQAQQATANGNPVAANEALNQMVDHAQQAVDGDRRLVPPYLLLAQYDAQQSRFSDAIEILNQGLAAPELASNTDLIMQEARVYFQQRSYDQALHQIFLALYIDPSVEAAYQLKIQIAMSRNRPGDAVLAAQDYLYYYPGSTRAYRLLGEARIAEHKDDLALAVFTQGLAGSGIDADAQTMLRERGQIYDHQGRTDLALADYNRLYTLSGDPQDQALRMQEALAAGQYTQALTDAQALTGNSAVSQGIVNLVHGATMVEQAQASDSSGAGETSTYQQAVTFLSQAAVSGDVVASAALRGDANEYLARAQLGAHDTDAALESIDTALSFGETGSRHYWRGRILQAKNDKSGAITDYEWVLTWSQIFPYPFRVDAQDRLTSLQ